MMAIKAWNPTIKDWIGSPIGSGKKSSFKVGQVNGSSFGIGGTSKSSFKSGVKTNKATGGGKIVSGATCDVGQKLVNGKCVGVNVKASTAALRKVTPAPLKTTCPTGYSMVNGLCRKRTVTQTSKMVLKSANSGGSKKSSDSGGGQFVYSSGTGTRITGTAKMVSKYGGQKGSFAKK